MKAKNNQLKTSELTMPNFPTLFSSDMIPFLKDIYTDMHGYLHFNIYDNLNIRCLNYIEFYIDAQNITAELINKRQKICAEFVSNPIQLIKSITQEEYIPESAHKIQIKNFEIYIKESKFSFFGNTPNIGFWIEKLQTPCIFNQKIFGFDIISLYSQLNLKNYSMAIQELYDHICAHKKIVSDTHRPKPFYVQENNPISIDKNTIEDRFYFHFHSIHERLFNNYGKYIGDFYGIRTYNNEFTSAYITLWRHHNSQIYLKVPVPPDLPLITYPAAEAASLQNKDSILIIDSSNNTNIQYLFENENPDPSQRDHAVALLYGGINNIPDDAKDIEIEHSTG